MAIINIRGTSGSGKSTLVHWLLEETERFPIKLQLRDWKKPKIMGYELTLKGCTIPTLVIGRYETQCGGCDSLSYKGSHEDIEEMVRSYAKIGNVVFEGLTISSTITRWRRISEDFPGKFNWVFMSTTEEECHRRILARSGREPKKDARGLADYQRKHKSCLFHLKTLTEAKEKVFVLDSTREDYQIFRGLLE